MLSWGRLEPPDCWKLFTTSRFEPWPTDSFTPGSICSELLQRDSQKASKACKHRSAQALAKSGPAVLAVSKGASKSVYVLLVV